MLQLNYFRFPNITVCLPRSIMQLPQNSTKGSTMKWIPKNNLVEKNKASKRNEDGPF